MQIKGSLWSKIENIKKNESSYGFKKGSLWSKYFVMQIKGLLWSKKLNIIEQMLGKGITME